MHVALLRETPAAPDQTLPWNDTVILQIFGVVLFSVISVVDGFTEIKKDT